MSLKVSYYCIKCQVSRDLYVDRNKLFLNKIGILALVCPKCKTPFQPKESWGFFYLLTTSVLGISFLLLLVAIVFLLISIFAK